MSIKENLESIQSHIPKDVTLVAVSKTKPIELLEEVYALGQRDFGENRVQELVEKWEHLPKDIRWHQIGHLQTNKVKYIAPFVHLIHTLDSEKLIREVNKRALENKRTISILLQFHIAEETTKFGFSEHEVLELIERNVFKDFDNISVEGVMGMATFTENSDQVKEEFQRLKQIHLNLKPHFGSHFKTISMGMSGDFQLAIQEGSSMVRVGSKIFGSRY